MVFSSIPAYLDPSNWQQQQPSLAQTAGTSSSGNPHLPLPPQPPPPLPQPHVPGGAGSIRPGSMADRARLAHIPMPEAALKCPRCDSTNTKFCYFNNYSLSQPRHFCKACRRYWTRGGALRNVPVGGGCRRNKRSKGSSSKSPVSNDRQTSSGSTSAASSASTGTASILGLTPPIPPLRFMAPLSQLCDYGAGDISLSYSGVSAPLAAITSDMNFQLGSISLGGGVGGSYTPAAGGFDQWRLQPTQMSSLAAGLDLPSGLYPFQSGLEPLSGYGGEGSQIRPKQTASGIGQPSNSVKMEDNQQDVNLSRQFLGIPGSDQYWSTAGSGWNINDLSGFSSSSTANPL